MRWILVDHAKARRRKKRGGDRARTPLEEVILSAEDGDVDVLALDEALTRLAEINSEYARVVEMRFFAGMTIDETASALGSSTAGVGRAWRSARAWLYRQLTKGDTEQGGGFSDVE
jgi:RNA polymerase sigma factor (TIGR02999 family)